MEKPGGTVGFRKKLKILDLCVYFEMPIPYLRRDVNKTDVGSNLNGVM